MIGALVAGLVPLLFVDSIGKVDAYRYATYTGIALGFLSLIPALMLRSYEAEERPEEQFAREARTAASEHDAARQQQETKYRAERRAHFDELAQSLEAEGDIDEAARLREAREKGSYYV